MKNVRNVSLKTITDYCNRLLQIEQIEDSTNAHNGLQVENRKGVSHIAAAVDASLATIEKAIACGADMMLVHHGLFWSPKHPWIGRHYELIQRLFTADMALYSAHLPLDAHPRFGNNVLLARAMGFQKWEPFFFQNGRALGVRVRSRLSLKKLKNRLTKAVECEPIVLPGGKDSCVSIGIVSGAAGAELRLAASEGVDTFVSGEGPHWTYALAEELGLNVLYGGHYATETFGVKALATHLSSKYSIEISFVDHPTGL